MTPEQVVEALEGLNFGTDTDDEVSAEVSARASRIAIVVASVLAAVLLISLISYGATAGIRSLQERRAQALVQAVSEGDLPQIRTLIDRGAAVGARGADGLTPLEVAARANQPDAARLLLAAGATPSDHVARVAMGYGHVDMLRILLDHGGNPNVRDTWHHRSLLEWAVDRAEREFAEVLLNAGADPNSSHALSMPALHLAASQGKSDLVRLLLNHGASPSLRWHHQTAADAASLAGRVQIARMLETLEE